VSFYYNLTTENVLCWLFVYTEYAGVVKCVLHGKLFNIVTLPFYHSCCVW